MTNLVQKRIQNLPEEYLHSPYKIVYEDDREEVLQGSSLKKVKHSGWIDFREIRVVDLKEYLEVKHNKNRIYTSLPKEYNGEVIDLLIHPYLMGVLLGDGGLSTRTICITSIDKHIIDKCREVLPEGIEIIQGKESITYRIRLTNLTRNPLTKYLISENLKVTSEKKFIPDIYKNSSYTQRIQLLQGLMDTDGTIDTQGTSSYSSSSLQLAKDVRDLIRSIGGIAKISSKIPYFTYKGEKKQGLISYRVNIRIPDSSILFSLPRKLERSGRTQYSDTLKLRIKSIEKIDE